MIPRYEISSEFDEGIAINNIWLRVNSHDENANKDSFFPYLSVNIPIHGDRNTAKNSILFVIFPASAWLIPYLLPKKSFETLLNQKSPM